MKRSRRWSIGWLFAFVAVAVVGPATAAFAVDPVEYLGCASSYKPVKAFSQSHGIWVMQAKGEIDCYEKFQVCLERSSWSGYRNVRCSEWMYVSETCGWNNWYTAYNCGPKLTTRIVNGCVQGTYDYHTKVAYVTASGGTRIITSEAYKAFNCPKNV